VPRFFAPDPGVLSILSIGVSTGNIAATLAANSPLFSFRWGNASNFCIPDLIQVGVTVSAAITASVATSLQLVIARSFSASDTGGTAVTLSSDNNVFRTSFATSLVTDSRIATTAALSAGTRTLDSQPLRLLPFVTGTAIGMPLEMTTIYDRRSIFPIVLDQNEGFIIRNGAAGPADGTFVVHVNFQWIETVEELT
jgi:hypothetical protein